MESLGKYIPIGNEGSVAYWEILNQENRSKSIRHWMENWAARGVKTVVCIFSEKGSSVVTTLEESLHSKEWKLCALEIPPKPETDESVYLSSHQILELAGKSNLVFLVPEELADRWEQLLGKMVITFQPQISEAELQSWLPNLSQENAACAIQNYRNFSRNATRPKTYEESNRGESSIFVRELPLTLLGIELGNNSNGVHKIDFRKQNSPAREVQNFSEEDSADQKHSSFNGGSTEISGSNSAEEIDSEIISIPENSNIQKQESVASEPFTELEFESKSVTEAKKSEQTFPDVNKPKTKGKKEKAKEEQPAEAFSEVPVQKKVRFPLQLKLMGVISLLLTVTVTTIILFASSKFKEDYEVRILETNFNLVNILGSKIKSDLKDILDKGKSLAEKLLDPKGPGAYADLFFRNEPDFLLVGIYKPIGKKLTKEIVLYNDSYLDGIDSKREELDFAVNSLQETFLKTSNSGERIDNLTGEFKEPIFSVSVFDSSKNKLFLFILRSERLLSSFQNQGINLPFFLNGDGDVIAHHDPQLLSAKTNWADLPLFESMLSSESDNKQTRYKDKSNISYYGSFQKMGFGNSAVFVTVLEDKIFEQVYRIQTQNLLIMAIALCIALIIVFFIAKNITIPLLALLKATVEITKGNFRIGIKPSTKDEVGLLTEYFVNMGKGLEEREKVKDALGRFVNKEIAELVLKQELTLGGERKQCAIFFSDIRSFTAISEKLEPEEVVEFLNEYMTEMVRCVNNTQGVVDKFIGDAIMATWGAIRSTDKDAENAVNGALLMRAALIKFNQGRGGDKRPIIRIGCGLNYGPVIAGQIGSEERLEYTVIGDAVNLASRVEALNKPFGTDILITQDLYEVVKELFVVEKMKSIKVKGKVEPQVIYAVLGRKDDPNHIKSLSELRAKLGIEWSPSKSSKAGDSEEEVKYEILD
ncbi:adenylate/guanylate cyclase domain-containing protein [Leptospira perolatii]|uniref:Adenylate/guanylate cyclase domain-containing protein n=1 Tax=Leptospira perolatii TaxID=2023191 RepID=A0A2M9ZR19_9LEPT|nr:adenylate/guanylate cyclase domain-containing protein [Leptospira perolatii]PJZ70547.1 adenylate/guanylate cyclase domain-containing protein [Leptospira perolatii]PJZ74383.1 adenylate/guanylate cyclase domain-containing protein [Leptospira perolatii]